MGSFDLGLMRRISAFTQQLFQGKRDLYTVFGYTRNPEYEHRAIKYLRQDVAARIVDAPAAALWTNPPMITSNDDLWNTAWNDLVARQNIFSALEKVDRLAGIGRYAILIIGFNDGSKLDKPVNTRSLTQKKHKINYLQVYSEASVTIKTLNNDDTSERFMQPELYEVQPIKEAVIGFNGKRNVSQMSSFTVHASRVLHVAENTLENQYIGSPRLERVYNILDDLLKVTGGSSETFWLTANRGLHIDIDKELELDETDAKNLTDEVEEYTHQLRRIIRTRGAKITNLGSDVPDPSGVFNVLISILSGATGIPRRILTGSEAGQLASDQDRANWADRIDERRTGWANPVVIYQLIKLLIKAGYLPAPENLEITVTWPSAFKMSPLESAQTSAQHARSATNFAKAIETMEKMKRGEPGSEEQLDEEGNPIPGTGKPAVEGITFEEELITIPEARKFIGLDKPEVTYDSGEDVGSTATKKVQRAQLRNNVYVIRL